MLNSYTWELYLKSGGRDTVEMFHRNLEKNLSQEFAHKIKELHRFYYPDEELLLYEERQIMDVIDWVHSNTSDSNHVSAHSSDAEDNPSLDTISDKMTDWYRYLSNNGKYGPQDVFTSFSDWIAYYTLLFSLESPTLFVPWFYKFNFNLVMNIADEFGISLPPIPAKKDYKGRFFYYGSVCKALKEFQHAQGLDSYELCAFLYDFAPKYIGGIKSYIIDDLPEPKGAYFIGATKEDMRLVEDSSVITPWQCNPETRAGDIVVMYNRAPVSAICSIWRSRSIGFNDPFFYYYRCTFIGNPTRIEPVLLNTLRIDDSLSQMWIVKKNMQGINGVEMKPSEFNRILELGNVDIPRLEYEIVDSSADYQKEKDVENLLIKPLLYRLDYGEEHYVQQLYIEIGNHNHALIPDFVILPQKSRGHQTAFAVVEAKISIQNQKQLNEASSQARSYSKLLGTKYQLIASKEAVWLFSSKDDYTEVILTASWSELQDADTFFKLYKAMGNR